MSINLFWNNICLITKKEETMVNNILKDSPVPFNVEYYGLGRSMTMLSKFNEILNTGEISADVIISTDTDIFHDNRFANLFHDFTSYLDDVPLKKDSSTTSLISENNLFTPFITIPLVIIYNQKALGTLPPPTSFKDLLSEDYYGKYTFGGQYNSAGKSVVKSIWYTYGKEKTESFVSNANIQTMPAMALRKVLTGETPIGIVPTIFSLRQGINELTMVWPDDGAIPIPSYVAVKKDLDPETISFIYNKLLGIEMQNFLVKHAAILPSHTKVANPNMLNEDNTLMSPSWDFLTTLNHSKVSNMLIK